MKLMQKTACDISYAYDAKGRLASAVPVYHCYLQDHRGNPGLSMIHGVNIRQFSRITGVCFGVIHRAKSGSESPLIQQQDVRNGTQGDVTFEQDSNYTFETKGTFELTKGVEIKLGAQLEVIPSKINY